MIDTTYSQIFQKKVHDYTHTRIHTQHTYREQMGQAINNWFIWVNVVFHHSCNFPLSLTLFPNKN